MEKAVLLEYPNEGIAKITLNRPRALNAINDALLTGLVDALRAAANARIIILEGTGERSFCAGEDLKETLTPASGSPQDLRKAFWKLQDITRLTSSAEAVVISAVQGFAVGGGAEIALAADFVIGGPGARFRFPEASIGLAVTGGITARLPHMVGLLRSKELLLTGRWVEAKEALNLGLVTELSDDPKSRALELALQLASLPATALIASKTSLERAVFPNMEVCLADEVHVANYCFSHQDANKAIQDFASRKAPVQESQTSSTTAAVRTVNRAWQQAVQCHPNSVFLRFTDRDMTYEECEGAIARLAGGLQHAGVRQGDRVLVMMRNSVEMVTLWLATNRLGAVWVPINTEIKSVTLQHVLKAAQAKLIVVDGPLWPELRGTGLFGTCSVYVNEASSGAAEHNCFSQLLNTENKVISSAEVTPCSNSAFLFTSGTTGGSKPCILSHEYFLIQARALIDRCKFREDDVLYCPFPLFHLDATGLTVMPAILLGATAALSVRFSASGFWNEIKASKATVYNFMGATLALTYKQLPKPSDRDHSVRLAWGVPLPSFAKEYEERFGHPLLTLYGSVEAGLPIFQNLKKPSPDGSCGRVCDDYRIRVISGTDEEVAPNTPGQLLIRNEKPNAFFKGYFNDPDSTAAAFSDLWLHTGDLVKVDEKGNIYFVGRIKDVIRRRGENINASEVEEEFLQHPDVISVAAYGIPSQLGEGAEQDVKVAVQMREGSGLSERDVWLWAVKQMARFQVPSVIEFVQEVPRTATGKVNKQLLSLEGGLRFDIRSLTT